MAIHRQFDVPLQDLGTFRLGGIAKEVVTISSKEDLREFFESPLPSRWFLLGGGSNVVFPDGDCDVTIVRLALHGIKKNDDDSILVSASENWDDVVLYAVTSNLSGIEVLSLIPGTAGAAPVQNMGAYGVEIKDVLVSLEVFDTHNKKFSAFSCAECKFGYRDSIFKHTEKGKYIITEIKLQLSKKLPSAPNYPGVSEYFREKNISNPTLLDIREAIIAIRTKKLPDPKSIASVGSFFKNPFVPIEHAKMLKEKYPTLAVFPVDESTAKVGTGSLIDALGWKGKKFGNFSLYHGNAMVIVNDGGGTRAELIDLINMIKKAVFDTYGIEISPEPELLDFSK